MTRRDFAPWRTLARALGWLGPLGLALLLAGGVAAASPLDPRGDDWEGLSQLVSIAQAEIGAARVVVAPRLDLAALARQDAVVLVHPTEPLDVDGLAAFLRAGGRVVLLDDYGSGEELLARFGVRRVPLPARPAEMLRGNPALAVAEPASAHASVRDVGRVVTNHATGLAHRALSPLLVVRGDGEPDVVVAVAGAMERGRFVAIGDGSVFMNSMLRYPGNRALAGSIVRFATEDDTWGRREGKLFVLANGFATTGDYGGRGSRVEGLLADAKRAAAETVETLRVDGMPALAAYLAAIAVGLGVVMWATVRAGRPHRRVVPRFVRPASLVAQGGVAGRAAMLGAPGTGRALALLELKSALEEEVGTRLGLDRGLSPDELARRARAAGVLDEAQSRELAQLLTLLGRVEVDLAARRPRRAARVRDAEVRAVAARVRALLEAAGDETRGRLGGEPP